MFLNNLTLLFAPLFPSLIFKKESKKKVLWLTFDDGPCNEVTPWILTILSQLNVKATFFLVGNQIKKNPALYELIIQQGHTIGNHSYSHKNGWITSKKS